MPSLLVDLSREFFAILRMFVDINYSLAWTTRILTVLLLAAIFTSNFWNPLARLYVVGDTLDKVVNLALAFVLYKTLSREAQRYREFHTPA